MANCAKNETSLTSIKNDLGKEFSYKAERDEFIVSYYANLYTKPKNEPQSLGGCIEKCLGNDIVSHPIVQGSILTNSQRLKLENPLTLFELDEAV